MAQRIKHCNLCKVDFPIYVQGAIQKPQGMGVCL